ncbi:hypothetical protein CACET_c02800 [Clostridium aceticum]|uniref:MerR family transcriptional regulator n=1 Tax=Clostridium aceticum TaxID=84022 RepID=A0A0G3W526_9CLOT|nr:hypothetical protein [Clostridium aceticum]AKL93796.1 hypothetical protein CACET_c02800 [Clostridium aceticum]
MNLINCPKCGRLIRDSGDGEVLCNRCAEAEGNPYKVIREYVYHHQGASVMEVAEATGVSKNLILKYVKEGRLSLLEERSILAHCPKCGAVLESGRACSRCLRDALSEERESPDARKKTSVTGFGRRRR